MPAPRSLLLVRPGALGDAVLTLPLLQRLQGSGIAVTLLGAPASWAFLAPGAVAIEDIGSRDWLWLFGGEGRLPPRARTVLAACGAALLCLGRGHAALDARLREAGLATISGTAAAPREAPARRDAKAEPGLHIGPSEPGPRHAARRLLAALSGLGIEPGPMDSWPAARPLAEEPLLRPTAAELASARATLAPALSPNEPFIVIHPGSGGRAKCWPAERYAALAAMSAQHLGMRPVLLLGPADDETGAAVRAALPAGTDIAIMRNRPLREVLALLGAARCYVGNDSGISHLAARATPTLALFGPTDAAIWRPLGARVAVLQAPGGELTAISQAHMLGALKGLLAASLREDGTAPVGINS